MTKWIWENYDFLWWWWSRERIVVLYLFRNLKNLGLLHLWLTFECNNLAGGVHDCGVCRDRPPHWVGGVVHINDHDLSCISYFLSHTDEFVWFHSERGEADVCSIDAHILKLKRGTRNWKYDKLQDLFCNFPMKQKLFALSELWKVPHTWLERGIRTLLTFVWIIAGWRIDVLPNSVSLSTPPYSIWPLVPKIRSLFTLKINNFCGLKLEMLHKPQNSGKYARYYLTGLCNSTIFSSSMRCCSMPVHHRYFCFRLS